VPNFRQALAENGQEHVVEILGLYVF